MSLSLLGSPALAEFSESEKQQILNQIDSMNLLTASSGELMEYLTSHPQDAELVRRAVSVLGAGPSSARARVFEALVWLAGGYGETRGDSPAATRRDYSRSEALDNGLLRHEDAFPAFRRAEDRLLDLAAVCTERCASLDQAIALFDESRLLYESFDGSLPYTDPDPHATLDSRGSWGGSRPDYRPVIENVLWTDRGLQQAWGDSNRLASDATLANKVAAAGGNYQMMLWQVGWAFGLLMGAEHPGLSGDIESILRRNEAVATRVQARLALAEQLLTGIDLDEAPQAGTPASGALPSLFAGICLDKGGLLRKSGASDMSQTIGDELKHLCDAWRASTEAALQTTLLSYALRDDGSGSGGGGSGGPRPDPDPTPDPDPLPGPTPYPDPLPLPDQPPPPSSNGIYDIVAANLPSPGEWKQIPGSVNDRLVQAGEFPFCDDIGCFKSSRAFTAWSGMAFDAAGGRWWLPGGGGHADYGGNEIYLYDFASNDWARITNPQPLTGPFMRDFDKDGINDVCRMPAEGPAASHLYDGAIYVPSTDEVLVLGASGYCRGAMSKFGQASVWSNASQSWRELPHVGARGQVKGAYDAKRDRVYTLTKDGRFRELDPQRNYEVTRSDARGWQSEGVADFDPSSRYFYYSSRKRGIRRFKITEDGKYGETADVLQWDDADPRGNITAFAIHAPTGDLVHWDGGDGMFRYDIDTGQVHPLAPASTPPVPKNLNRVFSKFVYIDSVDAFVGFHDPTDGVWVYRLPDGSTPGTPPPTPEPTPDPTPDPIPDPIPDPTPDPDPGPAPDPRPDPKDSASFDERCNAIGVVLCDPLDTEGPWGVDTDGSRRLMRNPDGSTGIPTEPWWRKWRGIEQKVDGNAPPRLDPGTKASGTGSLRFEYPSLSTQEAAGAFVTNFSDDLSRTFGPGDTFYLQYRIRMNCDFLYTDCDPKSPGYKQNRRWFHKDSPNPDAWTAPKQIILSTGDWGFAKPEKEHIYTSSNACTAHEIVLNYGKGHHLKGYHSCRTYTGFATNLGYKVGGSIQTDAQNQLGCYRYPEPDSPVKRERDWDYSGPNCFLLESDEWLTVQIGITLGPWQQGRPKDLQGELPKSRYRLWAAREGEPQVLLHDTMFYADHTGDDREYGKIWLLPYMTKKDPTQVHPRGLIWYDELLVSTEFIADPR